MNTYKKIALAAAGIGAAVAVSIGTAVGINNTKTEDTAKVAVREIIEETTPQATEIIAENIQENINEPIKEKPEAVNDTGDTDNYTADANTENTIPDTAEYITTEYTTAKYTTIENITVPEETHTEIVTYTNNINNTEAFAEDIKAKDKKISETENTVVIITEDDPVPVIPEENTTLPDLPDVIASETIDYTEITDEEIIDTEITDTEVIDTEVTDAEVTNTEITDTEVTDTEIADIEITDTEVTDTEIIDTEITDTEVIDTEITNTEIIDTEITDTEITDTEITDTEIIDTEVINTEIIDTEVIDIETENNTNNDIVDDTGYTPEIKYYPQHVTFEGNDLITYSWMVDMILNSDEESPHLCNVDYESLQRVQNAVEEDYFFYTAGPFYEWHYITGLTLINTMNNQYIEENNYINNRVTEIANEIFYTGMSEAEKVRAMDNWFRFNFSYIDGIYDVASGLKANGGVCMTYALLASALSEKAGLDCLYVIGEADNGSGDGFGGHAWNKIKVDGTWYWIDFTWNPWFGYYLTENLWEDHKVQVEQYEFSHNDPDYYYRY